MTTKCNRLIYTTRAVLIVALLALLPGAAAAQSSIAGLVTDQTGGVLPGVTVEAASPELIEQVRTAITDGQGRYAIVDLRPGIYTVSFTLPGFSTFQREEIQVTAGATVPINGQLAVGTVEETVTVSGGSPVVDIQQAAQRQVINRDVLDSLPTNRTTHTAGMVIPGLKMTGAMVGGAGNTRVQTYLVARGKTQIQNTSQVEGMDTRMIRGTGSLPYDNYAMAQEVAIDVNPASADVAGGGIKINMIPRDGGNTVSGDVHFSGMTGGWQSDNLTDELIAGGVRSPTTTDHMYDLNPAVGGPIVRDKLWYFVSGRLNRGKLGPAGATFFEPDPVTGELVPGTEKGFNDTATDSISFRLTWQASEKNKFTTYRDQFVRYQSHFASNRLHDWSTVPEIYGRGSQFIWPTKWTAPVTNRLLIEAGASFWGYDNTIFLPQPGVRFERATPDWFANASHFDLITRLVTRARDQDCCYRYQHPSWSYVGSVSYVTGSHTFKAGLQGRWGEMQIRTEENNGALQQRYREGIPDSVSVAANPSNTRAVVNRDIGFYVQDRLTIDRLTVNAGVRFETFKGGIGATSSVAGRFVGARSTDPFGVFDFNDVLPRFSVVYDLFGTARTALKFSVGRYVDTLGAVPLDGYNPISRSPESRNWFDTDLGGALLPTNGDDIAQENEIAASTNPFFGTRAVFRTDPDNLDRESSWDYSAGVQQEIASGVSASVMWYHTRERNLWSNREAAVTANDYTPFQIVSPLDGEEITVYNLNPGVATGDVVTRSSAINKRTYNGLELSVQGRLPSGGTIIGGFYTDRKVSTNCDTTNPNELRFCDESGATFQDQGAVPTLDFRHEYKLAIVHPLPWDFSGSLSFISYPGNAADADIRWQNVAYPVPSSMFAPVGGRTVPVTLQLTTPGTRYLERWNQLDVSFNRSFRTGNMEFIPRFDVYNLTNSATVLSEIESFGRHGDPVTTLPGRLLRLGVLLKF